MIIAFMTDKEIYEFLNGYVELIMDLTTKASKFLDVSRNTASPIKLLRYFRTLNIKE